MLQTWLKLLDFVIDLSDLEVVQSAAVHILKNAHIVPSLAR